MWTSVVSSGRLNNNSSFINLNASLLSDFAVPPEATWYKRSAANSCTLFFSSSFCSGFPYSRFSLTPAFSRSSCCALIWMRMASCASCNAFTRSSSLHSWLSPSTIIRFFSVAAIMKSISAFASCVRVGLIIISPSTLPTLTSESISLIGTSDTAKAALAAKQANASGITSGSEEISVISTCTSHK